MKRRTKAILLGLILGDGHLMKPYGNAARSALDIKYDQKHLSYLTWLHQELAELNPSPIRRKQGFHQYRFYTEKRDDIGLLRRQYYPKGTKRVPTDIIKHLTDPLTLAVWYQDDGTLDFRRGYHANALIATHCFSRHECELLAKALNANFGLDVRVCRCLMRGKLYYRLYITSKSMERFMELISPYMNKCFQYKILAVRSGSQQQR